MKNSKSIQAYDEARRLIPGGVNSPVRAFRNVGGQPLFISRGRGSRIYDLDGNEYLDFCMSWGALILGHADPQLTALLKNIIERGTSYGCPTLAETELARLIIAAIPSVEKIRFVSSGTEAVMSAVRAARAYTGRDSIIKFDGCYHGHADYLLVKAGSGAADISSASSTGVPRSFIEQTISLPFNDIQAVRGCLEKNAAKIAAVIIEPVPANMGLVLPEDGYLQELREITSASNVLLIFDEVVTGFRVRYGGAQDLYEVKPDLTCLGKIIGGGFPVGAFGGRKEIMDLLAPLGSVYQAGTLSGNPVAMNAGLAVLKRLQQKDVYTSLAEKGTIIKEALKNRDRLQVAVLGSMFSLAFAKQPIRNFSAARQADQEKYRKLFWSLLEAGIYLAPSPLETQFLAAAHTAGDCQKLVQVLAACVLAK